MSAQPRAKLYSPELLGLATQLAAFPLHDAFKLTGEARSRTCGSVVTCGLTLKSRVIDEVGLRVSACAVGQAAAAIFAQHAKGYSQQELARSEGEIGAWLASGQGLPDWPDIGKLSGALDFPARHPAILLPWSAASQALCKA